jgi:hypothetical protein
VLGRCRSEHYNLGIGPMRELPWPRVIRPVLSAREDWRYVAVFPAGAASG